MTEAVHSLSTSSLLLGDTTAKSALLFSPLLLSSPHDQPSYPNYTLPGSQLVFSSYTGPSSQTNLTTLSSSIPLILVPTDSSPTSSGLDNSRCAVQNANISTGNIAAEDNMLIKGETQWMNVGGEEGFRTMWVVGNLQAQTNYTGWLVDDQGGLSSPIQFVTKEGE